MTDAAVRPVPPLYCVRCGTPGPRDDPGPVVVCSRCSTDIRGHLRWLARIAPGARTKGPLSHEAVVDQLRRGVLEPDHQIAREGGQWSPIVEHADFRVCFLPGDPRAEELSSGRRAHVEAIERRRTARRLRALAAVALLGVSAGLLWVGLQSGALVFSESTVDKAREVLGEAAERVPEVVAEAPVVREIPGDALIAAVQERHADWPGPATLDLQRGRMALWVGTTSALAEAREHLERALALAPDDAEVAASLGVVLAQQSATDPSAREHMVLAVARASALEPDAPATLLAEAWRAAADDHPEQALPALSRCTAVLADEDDAWSEAAPGCALLDARLSGDVAALEALEARLPGRYAIGLARAQVAAEAGRWGKARELAEAVGRAHRDEPEPLRIRAQAHAVVGEWRQARDVAERLGKLLPTALAERYLAAEIRLKVDGDPRRAARALRALIETPGFETFPQRADALADAATAARLLGDSEEALALADRAIALDDGHPGAVLQRAGLLAELGRTREVSAALRTVDANRMEGHSGARFHVGAARIYRALGQDRSAVTELDAAIALDRTWPVARLERIRVPLDLGDLGKALDLTVVSGHHDRALALARSPLQDVWLAPLAPRKLFNALDMALEEDIRFADRARPSLALAAWWASLPTSTRELNAMVDREVAPPGVRAALAQHHMAKRAYRRAAREASLVLSVEVEDALMWSIRGLAEAYTDGAWEASFEKALHNGPNDPGVHWRYGQALAQHGRSEEARKALKQALALAPDLIPAQVLQMTLESAQVEDEPPHP